MKKMMAICLIVVALLSLGAYSGMIYHSFRF